MNGHRGVFLSLLFLLLVGGCTTSLIYNRLDWLITWYVDDYVDLSYEQKANLKVQLKPTLSWHRQEELHNYVGLLEMIETDVSSQIDVETVTAWTDELLASYNRVKLNLLDVALEFGATLSDEQMQEFVQSIWNKQAELEEKYLARSDEEFAQDSYERLEDNLSDYLGSLSEQQQRTLKLAAASLQRLDRVWLADRENWLKTLQPFLSREIGWQKEIMQLFVNRENYRTETYQRVFAHNMAITNQAITDVLNQRSDEQQRTLLAELDEFKADLQTLIAQKEIEAIPQQRKLL